MLMIPPPAANACSRVLYVGDDDLVVTGRSQDWFEEFQTDLWVFPRGMERNGEVGPKSISWTSKYGSLSASLYGMAVGEGVNEKGLGVYLLYLAESDYGNSTDRPRLSMGAWAQYILDNYATVAEAGKFRAFRTPIPGDSGHEFRLNSDSDSGLISDSFML
jgi:choloylglycine hydrolase